MRKAHVGLSPHRLKDNHKEAQFAAAWQKWNDQGNILAWLLDSQQVTGRPAEPSDRDVVVAATVVQWLGSPVGQGFLRELGYEQGEKE